MKITLKSEKISVIDHSRYESDDNLDYQKVKLKPNDVYELVLDDKYCRAQLPLLNPNHPNCLPPTEKIYSIPGTYEKQRKSMVSFVDINILQNSQPFQDLLHEIQTSKASKKIDWEMFEQRKNLLYFIVCGGLEKKDNLDQLISNFILRKTKPFSVLLKGPIISRTGNNGRLYIPVYPEKLNDTSINRIQDIQNIILNQNTLFYGIGFLNLTNSLDLNETDELLRVLDKYSQVILTKLEITNLTILSTHDDLILNSTREQELSLND